MRRSVGSSSSETLCSPTRMDTFDLPDFLVENSFQSECDKEEKFVVRERTRAMDDSPLSVRESTTSLHQKWLEENYQSSMLAHYSNLHTLFTDTFTTCST